MTISAEKVYPRTGDGETVYLTNVVSDPMIEVGDYTIYNDFVHDPREFEKIMCCIIIRSIMTGCSSGDSVRLPVV